MARTKNTEALVANMIETPELQKTFAQQAMEDDALPIVAPVALSAEDLATLDAMNEPVLNMPPADPELEAALNEGFDPEVDPAQAMAEAHGYDAGEAVDEAPVEAEAQADNDSEPPTSYQDLVASVTETQVTAMQVSLAAAFADRAAYEQVMNPNNDNIQKTLTKVQRGHLAHGIAKSFCAIEMPADYLNKSEVTGKRRNVYALEKLQDLIYGANTGHVKNAINRAVLCSMVRLEAAGLAFTGEVAKACASDKIAVGDVALKALLTRHTVAESTASTQSSSTMTALEDLGAVINHGTQKHPRWTFSETALAKRLREVTTAIIAPAVAAA